MVKKKILVGGVFDIIHFGHIEFLRKAKKLGDYLIVALESDKNVKRLKGKARPFHNQRQRFKVLKSLRFVDEVIILKDEMHDSDYEELVLTTKPDIIAITKGDPILKKKKAHARRVGAKVVEISRVGVASTTKIAKLLGIE